MIPVFHKHKKGNKFEDLMSSPSLHNSIFTCFVSEVSLRFNLSSQEIICTTWYLTCIVLYTCQRTNLSCQLKPNIKLHDLNWISYKRINPFDRTKSSWHEHDTIMIVQNPFLNLDAFFMATYLRNPQLESLALNFNFKIAKKESFCLKVLILCCYHRSSFSTYEHCLNFMVAFLLQLRISCHQTPPPAPVNYVCSHSRSTS